MSGMNVVTLVGRAVRQPELRVTPSGVSVTTLTVAVDRQRKVDGQPECDFVDCVCFGKTAENVGKYVDKGKLVGVEGRLESRTYTPKGSEEKRKVWEVIADSVQFLSPKNEGDE